MLNYRCSYGRLSYHFWTKPVVRKAKKSEARFKKRRYAYGSKSYFKEKKECTQFLDRLVNVVLPRVRDFEGVPADSFDGRRKTTL